MTKCPNCKKEIAKAEKTWTYGQFNVQAYSCRSCGTQFRDHFKYRRRSFTLKLEKGRGFIKA